MSSTRTPTPNSMHVMENDDSLIRAGSLTPSGSRPMSRSGQTPPVSSRPNSSGSGRPHTPSKSVVLQAVKRKPQLEDKLEDLKIAPTQDEHLDKGAKGDEPPITAVKSSSATNTNGAPEAESSDEYDTDLEDGEEEEGQEQAEPIKAPNELFMEFISCIMSQDYKTAQKLLTMILMYEPNHEDALKFKPLIESKIKQEQEAALAADDSSDEDDSDEDDSDESSGSSDEDNTDSEASDNEETEGTIATKT